MAEDARVTSSLLAAVPAADFDAAAAYQRLHTRDITRPRFGLRLPILKPSSQRMVLVLAAAFVLAAVITASANVSQIFAPKTATPVPVTVADPESLPHLHPYGTITWPH